MRRLESMNVHLTQLPTHSTVPSSFIRESQFSVHPQGIQTHQYYQLRALLDYNEAELRPLAHATTSIQTGCSSQSIRNRLDNGHSVGSDRY